MKFLNLFTIINLIGIFFAVAISIEKKNQSKLLYFHEDGRNNSSTPPTFILPATPAVAEIQENRKGLNRVEIIDCAVKLYDKDFKRFSLNNNIDNIYLTVEILKFQNQNNIEMTGFFDNKTKEHLNC